ncbi:MAG: histidine ammonia-lyase [Firmicutes bacterium]|nr:histidine ammonia-lyase [Bacillota bacterium]
MKKVELDGNSLTLEQLVAVARYGAEISLKGEALRKIKASREIIKSIREEGRTAYGITTGFGHFADTAVPEEMSNRLSTNLILSHSTATGEPYKVEQVRAMMLLRANALSVGLSGVRPIVVEMLIDMLNRGVTPVIPQKGSLGASGDLAPLSHMGLVMLGKGEAYYDSERFSGEEAMKRAEIETLESFSSKEGLGITNGTCAMTGVGALNLYDAIRAADMADLIGAMTLTALTGQYSAFQERLHTARGHKGQIEVAERLRKLTENCELGERYQGARVQDAYSIRCIPQVHGAVRDALGFILEKVSIELNAVTDNPLIFPEDGEVVSGGNFHGEPLALPFDYLGIACSELASISERRTERMVNADLSNGLPSFLAVDGGLNSGFMIVQYSSASMVSENKVLAHPASVDSIPSSAGQEDFVSMGTTAARKSGQILENLLSVLAFELLTACQAIDLRRRVDGDGALSPVMDAAYQAVREEVSFMEKDREIRIDIAAVEKIIRSEKLTDILREYIGE